MCASQIKAQLAKFGPRLTTGFFVRGEVAISNRGGQGLWMCSVLLKDRACLFCRVPLSAPLPSSDLERCVATKPNGQYARIVEVTHLLCENENNSRSHSQSLSLAHALLSDISHCAPASHHLQQKKSPLFTIIAVSQRC